MNIQIIEGEQKDLFQPIAPQGLAASHPLWERDLAVLGSWTPRKTETLTAWRTACASTGRVIYIFGPCVSSLDVGWHLVEMDSLSPWESVLAVSQWSGRGQLRRSWRSPAGNVFAALRIPWPPGEQPLSRDLASMVTAYACIRFFEQLGIKPQLKWPNDLLLNGKVGGILIEERRDILLAGIGINLADAPETSRDGLPAAKLSEYLPDKGPLSLWLELSEGIRRCFTQELAHLGQNAVIAQMNTVLAWKGEKVRLVDKQDKNSPLEEPRTLVGLSPAGKLYLAPADPFEKRSAELNVVSEGSLVRAT